MLAARPRYAPLSTMALAAINTVAPSPASRRAVARPIPPAPPVTTATRASGFAIVVSCVLNEVA